MPVANYPSSGKYENLPSNLTVKEVIKTLSEMDENAVVYTCIYIKEKGIGYMGSVKEIVSQDYGREVIFNGEEFDPYSLDRSLGEYE